MTIHDWITQHPDAMFRVIEYTPAPDILDEHGALVCGGEGESRTVFDSTTCADIPFDLYRREVIAVNTGDDGLPELEYMPDDCYFIG